LDARPERAQSERLKDIDRRTLVKLYFSPMTCSLAVRITLYEARADVQYVRVDTKAKQTEDGKDFSAIYPVGLVPVLELEPGHILTEVAAILQHLCTVFPSADLAPRDGLARARLQQWLSFIGSELQRVVYSPALDVKAPPEVKAYALSKAESRLAWTAQALTGQDYLLGRFSVADALLFNILSWSKTAAIDLQPWPVFDAFMKRMLARPHVAKALEEEKEMYFGSQAPARIARAN
jgi:glutathione S-transferase